MYILSRLYTLLVLWIALTLGSSVYSPLHAQDLSQLDSASFMKRFPNARLLDKGKLNLYSYRDYDGSFKGSGNSEKLAVAAGEALLELLDTPVDYYFIEIDGQFQEAKTEKAFKEKIEEWFADDTLLLQYIRDNKIKSEYLPYLVRMYNGHAPRSFDPGYENTPIEFVADGLIDGRDGRSYDIIIVNNVSWMAENLRFTYEYNNQNTTYGVYYTWSGASKSCPPGWKLPDETDWKTLFLGYGLSLKRLNKLAWDKDGAIGQKLVKDTANPKGFNAIRQTLLKGSAYFWTAKESSGSKAVVIEIDPSNRVTDYISFKKTGGVNVRCVCRK